MGSIGRVSVIAGVTAAAGWAALLVLWVSFVARQPEPLSAGATTIARVALVVALAATVVLVTLALVRGIGSRSPEARRRSLALTGLLLLSFATSFVGIDFVLAERYNQDEGIYTHHANEINSGRPFSRNLLYPHLTFYVDAFGIWCASLFPGVSVGLAGWLFDVGDWGFTARLVPRLIGALLAALCVIPAFAIGERLGGLRAACWGGALTALSSVLMWGAHENTCDIPAAFCASFAMLFVVRLLDLERTRDYLAAGALAGLAASAKYPAGMVAVAIFAVWIRGRMRERRWSWHLVVAAVAAIVALLATTPAILVYGRDGMVGNQSIASGFFMYKGAAALGVAAQRNAGFYGSSIARNFGLPALAIGILGWFLLARDRRVLLGWLLPYLVAYAALIVSVSIVVERNLFALIPSLAGLLGAGIATLVSPVPGRLRVLAVPVVLGWPLALSLMQSVQFTQADTRNLALAWVRANVPLGAVFVREAYTPNLAHGEYPARSERFAMYFDPAELADPGYDMLMLSSHAYKRFLEPSDDPVYVAGGERYRKLLAAFPLVHEIAPSWRHSGPTLRIYRLEPSPIVYQTSADFPARGIHRSSVRMGPRPDGSLGFEQPGHWAAFKGYFEPGRYRVTLRGEVAPGSRLSLANLANEKLADVAFDGDAAVIDLPARDKYYFYLLLAAVSRLDSVHVELLPAGGDAG